VRLRAEPALLAQPRGGGLATVDYTEEPVNSRAAVTEGIRSTIESLCRPKVRGALASAREQPATGRVAEAEANQKQLIVSVIS
jgi:hypothetical protein